MRFEIQGDAREGAGRAESRRMRRAGRIPAIVYGGGKDPSSISLERDYLVHQMERPAFYTSILTLKVGKDSYSVVVKEVQRHPAKSDVMHLDFQRIVEDEAITLNVPIRFIGEEDAIGVRDQGGAIEHILTDVEISCLPRHLPEFVEIDVSELGLNEIMHLSDIKYPEGVTSTALSHDQDNPVVAIHPPRREEIDEVEEPEEGELLEEGEVPEEGAEAAEGEAAPADDDESTSGD